MNKIRELRLKKCITQVELSKKAGVSEPYISLIEHGHRVGTVTVLNKIADALGVKIDDLIERR